VLTSGAVTCWGAGSYGRLGYGNEEDVGDDESVRAAGNVDLGGGRKAVTVHAGGQFTCALVTDKSVVCWGRNDQGQLGSGSGAGAVGDDETPAAALASGGSSGSLKVLWFAHEVLQLAAGDAHACAVLKGGSTHCWGQGSSGQLGLGSADSVGRAEPAFETAAVLTDTSRPMAWPV
jgi:alpha-tubulin suppressor-like RCC1 family protein